VSRLVKYLRARAAHRSALFSLARTGCRPENLAARRCQRDIGRTVKIPFRGILLLLLLLLLLLPPPPLLGQGCEFFIVVALKRRCARSLTKGTSRRRWGGGGGEATSDGCSGYAWRDYLSPFIYLDVCHPLSNIKSRSTRASENASRLTYRETHPRSVSLSLSLSLSLLRVPARCLSLRKVAEKVNA